METTGEAWLSDERTRDSQPLSIWRPGFGYFALNKGTCVIFFCPLAVTFQCLLQSFSSHEIFSFPARCFMA